MFVADRYNSAESRAVLLRIMRNSKGRTAIAKSLFKRRSGVGSASIYDMQRYSVQTIQCPIPRMCGIYCNIVVTCLNMYHTWHLQRFFCCLWPLLVSSGCRRWLLKKLNTYIKHFIYPNHSSLILLTKKPPHKVTTLLRTNKNQSITCSSKNRGNNTATRLRKNSGW